MLDKTVLHLLFFQVSKRFNKSNSFQYKLKGDLFPVGLIIGCNIFCLQVDESITWWVRITRKLWY